MNNLLTRRLPKVLYAALLTMACGSVTADDTEIYFNVSGGVGGASPAQLRPNVLFILDTSGSMGSMSGYVSGTSKYRIEVLKDVMNNALSEVANVNVGLMRFTGSNGGPVIFPVTYIDGRAGDVVGEPSDDTTPAYEASVSGDNDDGEETVSDTAVVLDDSSIELGQRPGAASGGVNYDSYDFSHDYEDDADQNSNGQVWTYYENTWVLNDWWVGFRFRDTTIPQGSTINSATLRFAIEDFESGSASTRVWGQDVADASDFTSCWSCYDVSSRSRTSSYVDWSIPAADRNELVEVDVTTIVQEIADSYSTDDMVFILGQTSGSRYFYTYEEGSQSNNQEARLTITYNQTPAGSPSDQIVALRFEDVQVPQGATVNSASLEFIPDEDEDSTASFVVQADLAANSSALTTTPNDIGGRTTTSASVVWNPGDWFSDDAVQSPDIAAILQEVVNQADWCGGNAVTILIKGAAGNTGYRSIYANEGGNPAKLNYSYDATSSIGCYRKNEGGQVTESYDDAEEVIDSGYMERTSDDLDLDGARIAGVRFQDMEIPQGATILEAELVLTSRNDDTGNITLQIEGELSPNASAFSSAPGDISDRTKTTNTVSWAITDNWSQYTGYTSPDIKTVIQEIVDQSGWLSGNSMALFVKRTGGSVDRRAYTVNSSASRAAYLRVRYQSSGSGQFKTVRQRLVEAVNDLSAGGNTPLVEVLQEAYQYWTGDRMIWGWTRDGGSSYRISHPGSYCTADNACDTAATSTYPPHGSNKTPYSSASGECPGYSSNDSDCAGEKIEYASNKPRYLSPITGTRDLVIDDSDPPLWCRPNFQILLTDGEANSRSSGVESAIEALPGVGNCRTTKGDDGSGVTYPDNEECAVDLSRILYEQHLTGDIDDLTDKSKRVHVNTFTIAFNLEDTGPRQFLKDIAAFGTGQAYVDGNGNYEQDGDETIDIPDQPAGYYEATSADDLASAISDIFASVQSQPSSIASPSLATNAFNRLLSRDEVFFGLFTPELQTRWDGNLKKYRVCTDTRNGTDGDTSDDCELGQIYYLDSDSDQFVNAGNRAIGDDGRFEDDARSTWSDVTDGKATTEGGAGAEITDYTERVFYTQGATAPAAGTALDGAGYKLTSANWTSTDLETVRSEVCPTPSTTSGSDCEKRMLFMLGKAYVTSETDTSATTRWTMNDVLHSSPTVVSYNGEDTYDPYDVDGDGQKSEADGELDQYDTFYDKILVGTNGTGGLHMINGQTGAEEWVFVPHELFGNQPSLYSNPETDHIYGLDATPVVYSKDVNSDGTIDPSEGDKVYVYIGMRRGGSSIYALDITPAATITSNSTQIVPKFLWSIDGSTTGFDQLGQTWSKPQLADIKVGGVETKVLIFGGGYDSALDSGFGTAATGGANNNGNAIYVVNAETGAKILSISGETGSDIGSVSFMNYAIAADLTVLDSDGDGLDDRIYAADTAGQILRVDLGRDIGVGSPGSTVVGLFAQLSTTGGSDCAGDSLETGCDERRFFEAPAVVQTTENGTDYDVVLIGSGNRANPLNVNTRDRYYALWDFHVNPMTAGTGNVATGYSQIPVDELNDLTSTVLSDTAFDAAAETGAGGWYFDLSAGEKILAPTVVLAGSAFFTSYLPPSVSERADLCGVQIGVGRYYAVNILNGSEVIDHNADDESGDSNPINERYSHAGEGIPSGVVPIFTNEGVVAIAGTAGGAITLDVVQELPHFRTYWYDE